MTDSANKLAKIYKSLPEAEQKTLLDFAEFLLSRAPAEEPDVPMEPLDIPRPEKESVVAAIKRLNQNYPMVERKSVFQETSDLMMQHMMQGRPAPDIIDELEQLFLARFRAMLEDEQ